MPKYTIQADGIDSLDVAWLVDDPDAVQRLKRVPYRMTGLSHQGGYDDAGGFRHLGKSRARGTHNVYVDTSGFAGDTAIDALTGWAHSDAGGMNTNVTESQLRMWPYYADAAGPVRDTLNAGQQLNRGDALTSKDGRFTLVLQSDSNLVMYGPDRGVLRAWGQNGATRFAMQTDGNLVLYAGNAAKWASDTRGSGARLVMQNDGNLVVYVGNAPKWSSETNGGKKYAAGGALSAIGGALGSVASVATSVVKPMAHLVTAPAEAALAIAQGKNVVGTLGDQFKKGVQDVKTLAPYAQTIVSFVPGVGAGVNAAVSAGMALAQGASITDAMVAAAKNALPGGPLAAAAFDTAYKMGKAAATGGNLGEAALTAARANLPGGPAAQQAFDTALAIAHGQNVQKALTSGAVNLAKSQALNIAKGVAPKMPDIGIPDFLQPNSVMSRVGPVVGNVSSAALTLLPANVTQVAKSVLATPALRGLPLTDLAKRLGVPVDAARQGVASVVSALQRVPYAGGSLPSLAPAHEVASQIGQHMSLDSAMTHFASRAAPVSFSPNAMAMRGMPGGIREIRWHRNARGQLAQVILKGSQASNAQGLDPASSHAQIGQGSTGDDVRLWQKIIGVAVDGQFGPNTKAATVAWQKAHGLVGDGIVGPNTWKAGIATIAGASTTPIVLAPAAAIAAATSPVAAANAPQIGTGSSGAAVVTWQKIIGVPADGQFGPATKAATIAFQRSHGLTPDGIVGPQTWAAGLGLQPVAASNPTVQTVSTAGGAPLIQTYVVRSGDTMQKIAIAFTGQASRVSELIAANPQIKNPNVIQVGQVLTLPSSWGVPKAQAASTAAPNLGAPSGTPAGVGAAVATLPIDITPISGTQPTGPIAGPIGNAPLPPLLPSVSSTSTPDGPVVASTVGNQTTISQPPITESKPGSGLLILGLALGAVFLVGGGKI